MNWYLKSHIVEAGDDAIRSLSEPNTISDWGAERRRSDKMGVEIWEGQFRTRRYIHRDENGKIDAAFLIGRRKGQKLWQKLLIHTRQDKRRQGLGTLLNQVALDDVGETLPGSSYSPEGRAFYDSLEK